MRKQSCIEQTARGPLAAVVSQGASSKYLEKASRRASKGKGKHINEAIKEVTYTYHKMTLNELSTEFATSCTQGLEDQQASAALAKYGLNILKPPETHHIRKILGYMFGGFCWLLWIGSLICFLAWKPIGKIKMTARSSICLLWESLSQKGDSPKFSWTFYSQRFILKNLKIKENSIFELKC